jgi:hypothetical protein
MVFDFFETIPKSITMLYVKIGITFTLNSEGVIV